MVRLIATTAKVNGKNSTLFQFHDGTIDRNLGADVKTHPTVFQFHDGTIDSGKMIAGTIDSVLFQFRDGTIY